MNSEMLSTPVREARAEDGNPQPEAPEFERLYRLLLDVVPDAAAIMTVDGRVLALNAHAETLTGYSRSELLGQRLAESLWIDSSRRDRFTAGVLRRGYLRDFRLDLRRRSGETVRAEVSGHRLAIDEQPCFLAIAKDASDPPAIPQALVDSEQRYRAVVEAQTEFIVRWLPDGTRTFVNEAYCRYFGQRREELEGTTFFNLISDADRERVRARLGRLTPECPVSTGRHRVVRPSGSEGWQEWTDHAFFDGNGTLVELQSVGRDVTALVETHRALERSRTHLAATLQALPDLIFRHTVEGKAVAVHAPIGSRHLLVPGGGVGSLVSETLPYRVARKWLAAAREVQDTGSRVTFEYSLRLDGGPYHFEARMTLSGPDEVLTIVRDVTDMVRARHAEQQAQSLFRAAWDQSPVSVLIADPDGSIRFANRAFFAAGNESSEALIGRPLSDLEVTTALRTTEGAAVPLRELPISRAIAGERVVAEEFVADLGGGDVRRLVVNAAPVRDAEGRLIAGVSVAQDVTEFRREAANREAADRRFRSFFEHMAAGAVALDFDGRIRRINPTFERMLGAETTSLVGTSLLSWMDPPTRRRAEDLLHRMDLGKIDRFWGEETYLRADGVELSAYSSLSLVRSGRDRSGYVIALVQDMSDRRELEGEVLEVAARERERLGRDLHDGLGQELTAAALLTKALERSLRTSNPEAAARAREIGEVARTALNRTRFLARGLLPDPLPGGISVALADLASNATALFSVPVELSVREEIEIADPSVSQHLFQICREAVTNAVRHGGATRIWVNLVSDRNAILVQVLDDGSGFLDDPDVPEGIGLRSMRFRARQIGGVLTREGDGPSGALITCRIPRRDDSP